MIGKRTIGVLLLIVVQIIYISGCASEEVRETQSIITNKVTPVSCELTLLDGECVYYSNDSVSCSLGTCSEGDCKVGKGKKEFPGGSFFEGNFKNGTLNGEGVKKVCLSSTFEGVFKDGNLEKGKLSLIDGSSYEGTLKNEQYEGKGVLKTASGDEYDGTWKSGKKNGAFSVIIASEAKKITYKDDEDVLEIARRKKEEAEEQRRTAREEAERRREERENERSRKSQRKKDCEEFVEICTAGGASYSSCKRAYQREGICD